MADTATIEIVEPPPPYRPLLLLPLLFLLLLLLLWPYYHPPPIYSDGTYRNILALCCHPRETHRSRSWEYFEAPPNRCRCWPEEEKDWGGASYASHASSVQIDNVVRHLWDPPQDEDDDEEKNDGIDGARSAASAPHLVPRGYLPNIPTQMMLRHKMWMMAKVGGGHAVRVLTPGRLSEIRRR